MYPSLMEDLNPEVMPFSLCDTFYFIENSLPCCFGGEFRRRSTHRKDCKTPVDHKISRSQKLLYYMLLESESYHKHNLTERFAIQRFFYTFICLHPRELCNVPLQDARVLLLAPRR